MIGLALLHCRLPKKNGQRMFYPNCTLLVLDRFAHYFNIRFLFVSLTQNDRLQWSLQGTRFGPGTAVKRACTTCISRGMRHNHRSGPETGTISEIAHLLPTRDGTFTIGLRLWCRGWAQTLDSRAHSNGTATTGVASESVCGEDHATGQVVRDL